MVLGVTPRELFYETVLGLSEPYPTSPHDLKWALWLKSLKNPKGWT